MDKIIHGLQATRLEIVPITFTEANEFVKRHHRHHKPMPGCKFVVACANGQVRGVAMCGRPVSRVLDDGWTIEVNRVCTDGTKNACSMLYGACWRIARALGYRKCITYTMKTESGASLRGVGWKVIGETSGRSWSVPSRPRVDNHTLGQRLKWSPVPELNETPALPMREQETVALAQAGQESPKVTREQFVGAMANQMMQGD